MSFCRSIGFGLFTPILLGCGCSSRPPPSAADPLPPQVVARAGTEEIQTQTVIQIAGANGIAIARALERAVSDALFAEEARTALSPSMHSSLTRAALGRSLLESLQREARNGGAATDSEIDQITQERWVELDRPASARVTHAVVLLSRGKELSARGVAEDLAEAVRGITDPKAFIRAAEDVPTGGLELRAESLPWMTRDGRAFSLEGPLRGPQQFDRAFAEASVAIATPGTQSEIVQTDFGFHVILLEAKAPALRVPLEDRRRILAEEVWARRAAALKRQVVESKSRGLEIAIARDFDAWTARFGGTLFGESR